MVRSGSFVATHLRRSRGSALVMAIVVSVVVTSLVMVIALSGATLTQTSGGVTKCDRAYFAAEAGAQAALWQYKHDTTYRLAPGSPLTGSISMDGVMYSYSVTVTGNPGSPVLIASTASSGTGSAQSQVHMTAYGNSAPVPTIASGGGSFNSTSLLNITGNLAVSGTLNTSGTFSVNGNVNVNGAIPGGISATGTKTSFDSTVSVPSVSAIYSSLAPSAYVVSSGTITSLDFTSHPVILVNGSATLNISTVTGTGTLLVNGNVSTGGDVGASGAPLNFNLVVNGTFSANNKFYLTGSLYSVGLVSFNNLTVLTGVLVTDGGALLNNHHTFNFATPPSFDPRTVGITVSGYGDATP